MGLYQTPDPRRKAFNHMVIVLLNVFEDDNENEIGRMSAQDTAGVETLRRKDYTVQLSWKNIDHKSRDYYPLLLIKTKKKNT